MLVSNILEPNMTLFKHICNIFSHFQYILNRILQVCFVKPFDELLNIVSLVNDPSFFNGKSFSKSPIKVIRRLLQGKVNMPHGLD